MNPNSRQKKPKGERITLGGRNAAEASSSRFNKRKSRFAGMNRTSKINKRRKDRADKINQRRREDAIKNNNVRTTTRKVEVEPGKTTTERVMTSPEQNISTKKQVIVPKDVRTGDKSYGRELPKGQTPTPKKDGTYGERLQYALQEGRKQGKTEIMFNGKRFATGERKTITETKKVPAKFKTITKTTPPKYREESTTQAIFDAKIPKLKTQKKRGAKARPVNARVVKTKG